MSKKLTDGLTYDYLSAESAPTREDRIETCFAFGGNGQELKQGLGSGCAKHNSRKFAQSGGCQLNLALGILSTFQNVTIILHGSLGCGSSHLSRSGLTKTGGASRGKKPWMDTAWIETNLNDNDVITGGIDKLREAVLYAESEYRPDAIIIASGCVPGIIGDDIDSLVNELQPQIAGKLVPIHCAGFKSKYVATGYDSAYHGLLKKLVDPVGIQDKIIPDELKDAAEKYKFSKTVNVFNVGSNSFGDEAELSRLLKALDLDVRVLPLFGSIDEISRIGEAALNISICATHDDYLLGHLKERFGTEYIIDTLPIGIKNTNRWLREIAKHFKLEAEVEKLIELENAQLEEALAPFKEVLQGKTLFVGGGETRAFTTGELFKSIGMKVIGLKSHNFDIFAVPMVDDLDKEDFVVSVAPGQPAEEVNLLNRLKPDLYIGHSGANVWIAKLGIPTVPLFGQSFNYMGYSGAFELVRKAARALQNTSLSKKLADNVPLPFHQEWYRTNPFENIKDFEELKKA